MGQSILLRVSGLFTNTNELGSAPEGALRTADNIVISKVNVGESRRGFDRLVHRLPDPTYRADKLFQYQNKLLIHYNTTALAYYSTTVAGTFAASSIAANAVTITAHGYTTGVVGVVTTAGVLPTGLALATDYYIVVIDANTVKFATSYTNALASAVVSISGGTGNSTFTPAGVQPYPGSFSHPDPLLAKIQSAAANQNLYFTSSTGVRKLDSVTGVPGAAGMFPGLDALATLVAAKTWASTAVTTADDTITIPAHGYVTGTAGVFSTAGTLPTGVTAGPTYYAIRVDVDTIKIAATYANAIAGTQIDLTTQGAGNSTFTPTEVTVGFMSDNSQAGYRVLWGITDANSNLVLGAPSAQAIVVNHTGAAQNVSLLITIPAGVTTSHFFQVYRSSLSGAYTISPLDDGALVYEGACTAADIAAKSVSIIDSTPTTLVGAALYTNATQQGILQSNDIPPYAADITAFRNCLFFANTRTQHMLNFSILAVNGSSGLQSGDVLTIAGVTYTADTVENVSTRHFAVASAGSASQNITDTAKSLVKVINQASANTTVYAYYVSDASALPGQIRIAERVLGGSAYYAIASAHGAAFSPAFPTSGTTVASSNSVNLNGLMYSKQQIPDAVPAGNIFYVGDASKKILRILATRDSLIIFKEDGVFRCTGTAPGTFAIDPVDTTAFLVAPESAVALDNNIYALMTPGICYVSDTAVSTISQPIQDQIKALFSGALAETTYYTFGVGYETDRKYILYTVTEAGDLYSNQQFVYDIFTKTWTRWSRTQQHAIVLSADDKIYAADPSTSYINQERKDGLYSDYTDEAFSVSLVSFSGLTLTLVDDSDISVGDRVFQTVSESSVVTAVDIVSQTITVADLITTWDLSADTFILKSIDCVVEWIPNASQNPGMNKHWSECTLLLKQNSFDTGYVGFYSDVSGDEEDIAFTGAGSGGWGRFPWGQTPWGGTTRSLPMRVYIPRNKQRCDLLSVLFRCREAWARFSIEGMSLVVRGISTRVGS